MNGELTLKVEQDHPLDYHNLLADGIAISQRLSGDSWTDYNVHDPGVTILEHMCFALSDLHYRTSFDIETYLGGSASGCAYNDVNLFDTQTITSRHPSSPQDLRTLLLAEVGELEDVIVEMRQHPDTCIGTIELYISIRPDASNQVTPSKATAIVNRVRQVFAANRNLNQQLADVHVCRNRFYQLHGEVELENNYLATQVLSEIFFQCCSDLTDGGYIPHQRSIDVPVSVIYRVIRQIKGIIKIHSLWIEDETGERVDKMTQRNLRENIRIHLPQNKEELHIGLTYQGRGIPVNYGAFSLKYQERYAQNQASRRAELKVPDSQVRFTSGTMKLSQYASIQNWFPPNYRIGARSFPPESDTDDRARALQLKAYLVLFENTLVDKLNTLNDIKYLFAPLKFDWFSSLPIHSEAYGEIPYIHELMTDEDLARLPGHSGKSYLQIHQALRILDYLIALYGEQVSDRTYEDFNVYFSRDDVRLRQYQLRKRYLSHIVEITKNRNRASNIQAEVWNKENISGLQLKISLLLDFSYLGIRSLSFGVFRNGIQVAFKPSQPQDTMAEPFAEFCFDDSYISAHFQPVTITSSFNVSKAQLMAHFGEKFVCKQHAVTQDFIEHVVRPNSLVTGQFPEDHSPPDFTPSGDNPFHLLYWSERDGHYYLLNSFPDQTAAIKAGQVLRKYFIQLSLESEGMHIVENDLLAADLMGVNARLLTKLDLFGDQITVIMPRWTARTANPDFQAYVEETVIRNTPAHLFPRILWLDLKSMYVFEKYFKNWLTVTREADAKPQEKAEHAANLARCIDALLKRAASE